MGNEFKRIVLLKGFQHISDYQFSVIKCLLAKDLRLTSKMQDEYDRVKIANLMEAKFRGPACVDKLIELVKDIEEIKDLAKTLKNEKLKGTWKNLFHTLSVLTSTLNRTLIWSKFRPLFSNLGLSSHDNGNTLDANKLTT